MGRTSPGLKFPSRAWPPGQQVNHPPPKAGLRAECEATGTGLPTQAFFSPLNRGRMVGKLIFICPKLPDCTVIRSLQHERTRDRCHDPHGTGNFATFSRLLSFYHFTAFFYRIWPIGFRHKNHSFAPPESRIQPISQKANAQWSRRSNRFTISIFPGLRASFDNLLYCFGECSDFEDVFCSAYPKTDDRHQQKPPTITWGIIFKDVHSCWTKNHFLYSLWTA